MVQGRLDHRCWYH